jgi:thiamine pyrophosphokinase
VGQQISVFSFGASDFHSEGLVYPLPHDLTNWWQGTLNEANSDVIRISADGYFLVFQEY